ncbi:MAG: four-helix bundle copper-binding protein [Terrimicrobiaceae bacterium]|nr:four-helix bundle copper-binding protein [Terrimicrobiaceae bacterium]
MTDSIPSLFDSHPVEPGSDRSVAIDCLRALTDCAGACNVCADACLSEGDPASLRGCIRTCLDCSDVCAAAARVIGRLTATDKDLAGVVLRACARVCRICAKACSDHAEHMRHCSLCAQSCLECAGACEDLLAEPAIDEFAAKS